MSFFELGNLAMSVGAMSVYEHLWMSLIGVFNFAR
jgi:hypothetical protein